jgi:general secretion pathway protein J
MSPIVGASRERGFTLVEMLVSLAVLGLVSVMLFMGVAMAARIAQRAQASDVATNSVAAAQLVLRDRLEGLQAVTRSDTVEPIVDARGTPNAFDFVGPALERDQPDALQYYHLIRTADGDLMLYFASSLNPDIERGDKSMSGWRRIRLLTGTTAMTISYFGTDLRYGGRRWQQEWISRQQPPDLLRIAVSFAPGDGRVWPDLVVRPGATLNTACKIDSTTGRCGEGA